MNSEAYWQGVTAAERGQPRECPNPWNARWLVEWLRGFDSVSK